MPCREVFISHAIVCPKIAAEIVALIEHRNNAQSITEKRRATNDIHKLTDKHSGALVNVEDSTVHQLKSDRRRLKVKLNNCWSAKTGKPYEMILTHEEWYVFGKPMGNDTNIKNQPLLLNPIATWRLK